MGWMLWSDFPSREPRWPNFFPPEVPYFRGFFTNERGHISVVFVHGLMEDAYFRGFFARNYAHGKWRVSVPPETAVF
jgi:hypothetical protein